jgi:hypothetical protein
VPLIAAEAIERLQLPRAARELLRISDGLRHGRARIKEGITLSL